jgi:hypothetical protein
MDTIKKRLQSQNMFTSNSSIMEGRPYYNGIVDCVITMFKTDGTTGLYCGSVPSEK